MPAYLSALFLGFILLAPACARTTTTSRTWAAPPAGAAAAPSFVRHGHVEWIRETVRRTEGNPGAGAAAGALVGAAGGALIGAGQSKTDRVELGYEVFVRFDNGEAGLFHYPG